MTYVKTRFKRFCACLAAAAFISSPSVARDLYAQTIQEVSDKLKSGSITDDNKNADGTIDVSAESYLNVRTGPGTNYEIIGRLHRDDKVKVLAEKLGWYKINYQGTEAWINGYYVAGVKADDSMPPVYGTVVAPGGEQVGLRVGAGINNPVEESLPDGARVKVVGKQDGWYKVEVPGHERPLWIDGAFLKLVDSIEDPAAVEDKAAYVNVGYNSNLNLRTGPSTDSPILQELTDGTSLKVIGVYGKWYKVRLANGAEGYCYSDYISMGAAPAQAQNGSSQQQLPGAVSGGSNVLESMQLPSDASQVTPEVASKILSGLGYDRFSNFQNAIKTFQSANFGSWSSGQKYTSGALDEGTKKRLLEQAKLFQTALKKYPQGTISKDDQRFKEWVSAASTKLTNMPSGLTDANGNKVTPEMLVTGILIQESGKTHWKDKEIVISRCGAIGFMQIMPFHSESAGNIYDPQENLAFGVKYINEQLSRTDWKTSGDNASSMVAKALAAYNGGPGRSALKNMSWDDIVRNNAIPSESIGYAINIRKKMNLPISDVERQWLANR